MATSVGYKDFVLERLSTAGEVAAKPMMGEYLLYLDGVNFGGIYDNRLLLKRTATNADCGLPEEFPYPGAKPMYAVQDLDDEESLALLVQNTARGIKNKIKKKIKKK